MCSAFTQEGSYRSTKKQVFFGLDTSHIYQTGPGKGPVLISFKTKIMSALLVMSKTNLPMGQEKN